MALDPKSSCHTWRSRRGPAAAMPCVNESATVDGCGGRWTEGSMHVALRAMIHSRAVAMVVMTAASLHYIPRCVGSSVDTSVTLVQWVINHQQVGNVDRSVSSCATTTTHPPAAHAHWLCIHTKQCTVAAIDSSPRTRSIHRVIVIKLAGLAFRRSCLCHLPRWHLAVSQATPTCLHSPQRRHDAQGG